MEESEGHMLVIEAEMKDVVRDQLLACLQRRGRQSELVAARLIVVKMHEPVPMGVCGEELLAEEKSAECGDAAFSEQEDGKIVVRNSFLRQASVLFDTDVKSDVDAFADSDCEELVLDGAFRREIETVGRARADSASHVLVVDS